MIDEALNCCYWLISISTNSSVEIPHRPVRDGDIIQLVHIKTNRTLNR